MDIVVLVLLTLLLVYPGGWHIGTLSLAQETRFYGKLERPKCWAASPSSAGASVELYAAAP